MATRTEDRGVGENGGTYVYDDLLIRRLSFPSFVHMYASYTRLREVCFRLV